MTTADRDAGVRFYAEAIEDGEALYAAAEIDGIDGEVAMLRLHLARHGKNHPEDVELMQKSIALLVRAVVARHHMSPQRADEIQRALVSTIDSIRIQVYGPEDV